MEGSPVPRSSYPDPYIPAPNSLWCHRGNTQPGKQTFTDYHLIWVWLHTPRRPNNLHIQILSINLVDDAAGEERRRFLTVSVEIERHQSVGAHREVVVHGQNLRGTGSMCVHTLLERLNTESEE